MPIYVYECDTCHRREERFFGSYEEMQAREANGPQACKPIPKKCAGKLHRMLSAPNFAVKGFNAANGYSNKGVR